MFGGGWRSCLWVSRPPSQAVKVSRARAAARSPRQVPSLLGTRAEGSGAQAHQRQQEGASLAASPRELAPRGRRGRCRPAAKESPAGRPRPAAPPYALVSPHPKIQPQPLGGEALPAAQWDAEKGPLQTGAPSPRRPVLGVPAPPPPLLTSARGTGWVPYLGRSWVGAEPM